MTKRIALFGLAMVFSIECHAFVSQKNDQELNARFECLEQFCTTELRGSANGCFLDRAGKRLAFDSTHMGHAYYLADSGGTYYTEIPRSVR